LKVAGARLVDSKRPSPNVVINLRRRRTRAAGILFLNAISRASLTEHAIVMQRKNSTPEALLDGFAPLVWGVVLFSAQVATEGRLEQ
jgi:hypothetical protein